MHHQIDSLVYLNRLRYLPPTQKLVFTLMLIALIYASGAVVQLVIVCWLLVWVVGYAGIPLKFYGQLLIIPLGFWLLSLPAIALGWVWLKDLASVSPDVWVGFSLGSVYFYLSKTGITQAGELFGRAIALTSSMYFLLLTTPFAEILKILSNLHCPTLVIELLTLMYRFIFVLTETAHQLLLAQRSRGGYHNFRRSMASLGILVSQLLQRSLNNYRQTVLAFESRGFRGKIRFFYSIVYKSNPRYTREAIGGYLCLLSYTLWEYVNRI